MPTELPHHSISQQSLPTQENWSAHVHTSIDKQSPPKHTSLPDHVHPSISQQPPPTQPNMPAQIPPGFSQLPQPPRQQSIPPAFQHQGYSGQPPAIPQPTAFNLSHVQLCDIMTKMIARKDVVLSRLVKFNDSPVRFLSWKQTFLAVTRELGATPAIYSFVGLVLSHHVRPKVLKLRVHLTILTVLNRFSCVLTVVVKAQKSSWIASERNLINFRKCWLQIVIINACLSCMMSYVSFNAPKTILSIAGC